MNRIFGLETEYGIASSSVDGSRRLGPEEIARYLFRPVVAWGRSSNVFLPNGSRLYLDVGSHPEYASAECDSVPELVAQDAAGQELMVDLLGQAQEALAKDDLKGTVHLVKNNKDSAGNSYGSHENFLIRRRVDFTHLTNVLLPFLVTRQLLVGAGALLPAGVSTEVSPSDTYRAVPGSHHTSENDGSLVYGLSSRSDVMWEGVSSATTRSRPIINARDEPHADAEKYRRLHVIVGDSSMSQTTTELKVGSAGLVIDLIEAGIPIGDLSLRNPIRDIRHIARDLRGETPVELRSGATTRARDLLAIYLKHASALVQTGDHSLGDDASARRVIDLWERMLTALESGDFSSVDTEVDWVIKKKLVDRYAQRSEAGLADPRVARLDLAYHDLTPTTALFPKLEARGLAARIVDSDAVQAATTTPPQTTRAKIRGEFVKAAHDARRDYTVDWVHLRLNDHAQRAVVVKDPFANHSDQAQSLIESLDAADGADSV